LTSEAALSIIDVSKIDKRGLVMGFIERLRKPDWLQEMQTTLTFVLVVMAVLGGLTVIALVTGDSLVAQVPTSAVAGVAGATGDLRPGVVTDPHGTVDILVRNPDAGQLVDKALISMPTYLITVTVLVLLLGVLRRARRDNPFLPATVRRLRVIAVVVLVGGQLAFTIETVAAMDLSARVTNKHMGTIFDVTPVGTWLLLGFGFFAIAEVVNRGRAMRAELDSVI
jgi:Protein of unknown function (DUF2975)